jgi:hypothetical protein
VKRYRLVVIEENPGAPTNGRVMFQGPVLPEGLLEQVGGMLFQVLPGIQAAAALKNAFGSFATAAEAFTRSGAGPRPAAPSPRNRRRPPAAPQKKGTRR